MFASNTKKHQKPTVQIYYDRDCRFCRRAVELIVRWFLVRTSQVRPAQDIEGVFKIMQEFDSWVVINEKGERFTTFAAGVEIARCSPLLQWLVPLAKPRFMQRFGERVYRLVAQNRRRIWLP